MTPCTRPNCGGSILPDDDPFDRRLVCCLCGRSSPRTERPRPADVPAKRGPGRVAEVAPEGFVTLRDLAVSRGWHYERARRMANAGQLATVVIRGVRMVADVPRES